MQRAKQLIRVLTTKRYRRWFALGILLLTVGLVVHFFVVHPEYVTRLRSVSPVVILLVVLINIPAMLALAWIYDLILRLCGKSIDTKENLLLTAYSSIINFFGPLQSGPGVRAVYLKTRHQVRIRDYALATLLYYALYATFSAFCLLVGMRPWWQTVLAIVAAVGISFGVIKWFIRRQKGKTATDRPQFRLQPALLGLLLVAVSLQVICIAAYYYVELRAVNPMITINQAISYSGAANFALFVSLTPDAIGFREAFLIFSQNIHHVSTADILSANIIDRGAYALYLALLFVLVASVHARERLRLPLWRSKSEPKVE